MTTPSPERPSAARASASRSPRRARQVGGLAEHGAPALGLPRPHQRVAVPRQQPGARRPGRPPSARAKFAAAVSYASAASAASPAARAPRPPRRRRRRPPPRTGAARSRRRPPERAASTSATRRCSRTRRTVDSSASSVSCTSAWANAQRAVAVLAHQAGRERRARATRSGSPPDHLARGRRRRTAGRSPRPLRARRPASAPSRSRRCADHLAHALGQAVGAGLGSVAGTARGRRTGCRRCAGRRRARAPPGADPVERGDRRLRRGRPSRTRSTSTSRRRSASAADSGWARPELRLAVRHDHQQAHRAVPAQHVAEQHQARALRPVQVVEHEHRRPLVADRGQQAGDRLEQPEPVLGRRGVGAGRPAGSAPSACSSRAVSAAAASGGTAAR